MILEGLQVMLIGMTVVFSFLLILVGLMNMAARFFEKFSDRFPFAIVENPIHEVEHQPGIQLSEIALAVAVAHSRRQ